MWSYRTPCQFELTSIVYGLHDAEEVFENSPQYNTDLHLVHTLKGQGFLHVGSRCYEATPGSVLSLPIHVPCTWSKSAGQPWEIINLHYQIYMADRKPISWQMTLPTAFRPDSFQRIEAHLRKWVELANAPQPITQLKVTHQILSLITRYWDQFAHPVKSIYMTDPAIVQLSQYLSESIHTKFDAMSLAHKAHLSVSQMNRRFRQAMGMSPKAFWQQQRLAEAKTALLNQDQSVTAIATSMGFNDPYYFCRWFKLQAGISPGRYRRDLRHRVF